MIGRGRDSFTRDALPNDFTFISGRAMGIPFLPSSCGPKPNAAGLATKLAELNNGLIAP